MRTLAVGKEVSFASIHSLPSNDDVPRDIGTAEINGVDLTSEILRSGWGKLKEAKREPTPEDLKRKDLENEAREAKRGVWDSDGPPVCLNLSEIQLKGISTLHTRLEKSTIPCLKTHKLSCQSGRVKISMVKYIRGDGAFLSFFQVLLSKFGMEAISESGYCYPPVTTSSLIFPWQACAVLVHHPNRVNHQSNGVKRCVWSNPSTL